MLIYRICSECFLYELQAFSAQTTRQELVDASILLAPVDQHPVQTFLALISISLALIIFFLVVWWSSASLVSEWKLGHRSD